MTDGQERVRLRAREGEAFEWTRRVARRAGTLKDMMDDARAVGALLVAIADALGVNGALTQVLAFCP